MGVGCEGALVAGLTAASFERVGGGIRVLCVALPKGQDQGPGLSLPGLPVLRLLGLLPYPVSRWVGGLVVVVVVAV